MHGITNETNEAVSIYYNTAVHSISIKDKKVNVITLCRKIETLRVDRIRTIVESILSIRSLQRILPIFARS